MKDAIDSFEVAPDLVAIAYVRLDQFGVSIDLVGAARAQIVDYPDSEIALHQRIDQVGADESRAARHQHDSAIASQDYALRLTAEPSFIGILLAIQANGWASALSEAQGVKKREPRSDGDGDRLPSSRSQRRYLRPPFDRDIEKPVSPSLR